MTQKLVLRPYCLCPYLVNSDADWQTTRWLQAIFFQSFGEGPDSPECGSFTLPHPFFKFHLWFISLLTAIDFLRYLPLRHLMRRSCSILSLWAVTEPCESDSQSGTLWFYDIICFLTHVSCSVLNFCMFEGASHFHRHFFANQSLSPSTGVVKSSTVVVTRCFYTFTRCGSGPAVHFNNAKGSSSLGQDLRSAWERPNLARQISHSFIARATRVNSVDLVD